MSLFQEKLHLERDSFDKSPGELQQRTFRATSNFFLGGKVRWVDSCDMSRIMISKVSKGSISY